MKDDPTEEMQNKQVKENNAERKRAMAKERSGRFREKKRPNVLNPFIMWFHSFHLCRMILSTHRFFRQVWKFVFVFLKIKYVVKHK